MKRENVYGNQFSVASTQTLGVFFANFWKNKIQLICLLAVMTSACQKGIKAEPDQIINTTSNEKGAAFQTLANYEDATSTTGYYDIATFNVRQDVPDPGQKAWTVRRPLVKDMVLKYHFDIFGVQEAKGNQVTDMLADLTDYAKIGTGRDGNSTSEHSAIFYRKGRFSVLSSGQFWLSPGAPTTATGPSWDASYKRICTWGKFKDNTTGNAFWVFNSHFDNDGAVARDNSASLVLSQIQAKIGLDPVIFTGDLNCDQNSSPFATLKNSALLEETWDIAPTKTPVSRQTGNWWNINPAGNSQIDQIFTSSQFSVIKHKVLWDNYDGVSGYNDVLPSDHFPVVAEMKLTSPATPIADGKYKLIMRHTGKAVTVKNSSLVNGGIIQQWVYSDDDYDGDEWYVTQIGTTGYYKIVNVRSGKALAVSGASMAASAPLVQWDYVPNGNSSADWVIADSGVSGWYIIRNVRSSLSLNVDISSAGQGLEDGAPIIQYGYGSTAQTNMQVQFVPVP